MVVVLTKSMLLFTPSGSGVTQDDAHINGKGIRRDVSPYQEGPTLETSLWSHGPFQNGHGIKNYYSVLLR